MSPRFREVWRGGTGKGNVPKRSREEIRAEVLELIKQVVPEELDQVDEMMLQFYGRENELVDTLVTMQQRAAAQSTRPGINMVRRCLEVWRRGAGKSNHHSTSDCSKSTKAVSAMSSMRSDTKWKYAIDQDAAIVLELKTLELDQLVESGDWEGVVRLASTYESQNAGMALPTPPTKNVGSHPPTNNVESPIVESRPPTDNLVSHSLTHNVGSHSHTINLWSRLPPNNVGSHPPTSTNNVGSHPPTPSNNVESHPPTNNIGLRPPTNNLGSHPLTNNAGSHSPTNNLGLRSTTKNLWSQPPTNNVGSHPVTPTNNIGSHSPMNNDGSHPNNVLSQPPTNNFTWRPPTNNVGSHPPMNNFVSTPITSLQLQIETSDKMDYLLDEVKVIRSSLNDLKLQVQRISGALAWVATETVRKCQSLVWMVPANAQAGTTGSQWIRWAQAVSRVNPNNFVARRYHVYFLCQHDFKVVRPPLKIWVTRNWVRRVAPLLKLSLTVIKMGMRAYNLPFPVPDLALSEQLAINEEFITSFLGGSEKLLSDFDAAISENPFDHTTNREQIRKLTGDAYETIAEYALKDENSEWKKSMVLVFNCQNTPLWVKKEHEHHYLNTNSISN